MHIFQQKRSLLNNYMEDNSALILFSNQLKTRNNDVDYEFRQASNFLLMTSFKESSSIIVFKKHDNKISSTGFVQEKDFWKEIWTGKVAGLDQAKTDMQLDQVFSFDSFLSELDNVLKNTKVVYFSRSEDSYEELRYDVYSACQDMNIEIRDDFEVMYPLRSIKSLYEIQEIEYATKVNIQAHKNAYQTLVETVKQNGYSSENLLAAEFDYHYRKHNLTWAYGSIVASGKNACILHYTQNNQKIDSDKLVLIDAGCESHLGYASDITRCYPASGKFNSAQTKVYNAVLDANVQCIEMCKNWKGLKMSDIHNKAVMILTNYLIDWGILNGSLDGNIKQKKYKKYFPHGIGHMLGVDVHDLSPKIGNSPIRGDFYLESGMTFTIEPGLYFANYPEIDDSLQGIGVRIEDNILITSDGYINLSENIPKQVTEVENWLD